MNKNTKASTYFYVFYVLLAISTFFIGYMSADGRFAKKFNTPYQVELESGEIARGSDCKEMTDKKICNVYIKGKLVKMIVEDYWEE